jgi:hypothetical protein
MTSNVKQLTETIEEFSLISVESDNDMVTGSSEIDFQEILTSLASIYRRKELEYRIEYRRPDQPVFRLRSDDSHEGTTRECEIDFAEPGRNLKLKIEPPGETVLEGLIQELKILGELESTDKDETTREPELNLLVSRTFQAELYAEYQRWKRYESPFLVALAHLKQQDTSWDSVGRAFKHVAKTRDMIGYLGQGRVAAFFPSLYDSETIESNLSERLEARFEPEELELSFLQVPQDYDNWNSLKKRVFSPIYLTET